MNTEENDPDTLQMLDEIDQEWVKLWRKPKRSDGNFEYFIPDIGKMRQLTLKSKSTH